MAPVALASIDLPWWPVVCKVGNKDGVHHVAAELCQTMNDVGFTIPASAVAHLAGEAMSGTHFKDLQGLPAQVLGGVGMAERNAAHLAKLLARVPYPPAA